MLKQLWNFIAGKQPPSAAAVAGAALGSARPLELGSRWVMPSRREGNPWRDESIYAVVTDISAGWVRLKLHDGGNYEMTIKLFFEWFKEAPNEKGQR